MPDLTHEALDGLEARIIGHDVEHWTTISGSDLGALIAQARRGLALEEVAREVVETDEMVRDGFDRATWHRAEALGRLRAFVATTEEETIESCLGEELNPPVEENDG